MRVVKITRECDRCGQNDSEVEVVSVQLTGGADELEADLCTSCLESATFGFRKKVWTCGTCSESFGTPRGLSMHKSRVGHS